MPSKIRPLSPHSWQMLHLEQLDAIPMRSPAGLDPEVTSSNLLTLTTTHKHQLQICKAK